MNIKDNFLPKENLSNLKNLVFSEEFPWFFQKSITSDKQTSDNEYYFVHILYDNDRINSSFFNVFETNLLNKLEINALIRVKVNFYHKTETLIKHDFHTDYSFPHKTALFYFNNNDGFTEMENGTKIESIENRLLILNGIEKHRSTSCTNTKGRFNININYI